MLSRCLKIMLGTMFVANQKHVPTGEWDRGNDDEVVLRLPVAESVTYSLPQNRGNCNCYGHAIGNYFMMDPGCFSESEVAFSEEELVTEELRRSVKLCYGYAPLRTGLRDNAR